MKINYKDADNYSSNSTTPFFSLPGDGDTAIVRILAKNMDDVYITPIHEGIKVGDNERKVNCLRKPNGSIDDCPLCKAGNNVSVKMYLELMVYTQDNEGFPTGKCSYQIWERGKKYITKISAICARYASKKPLWDTLFEITRSGNKGDQNTSYEILPITDEDFYDNCPMPKELPEPFEPIGTIIMDKSYEELEYFTKKGKFPETEQRDKSNFGDEEEMPRGRRCSAVEEEEEKVEEEEVAPRRTRRIG